MQFVLWGIWGLVIIVLAFLRSRILKAGRLEAMFRLLGRLEIGVLALLLGGLILMGCTQIVLRNLFHSGLLWADPLMRHIVLWLGCLGAALATVHLRHINIDVFTRLLPSGPRALRRSIVYGATALTAFVLGVSSWRLVLDERAFGEVEFWSLPTWTLQLVLPFAFFMISYRSLVNLMTAREARMAGESLETDSLESIES